MALVDIFKKIYEVYPELENTDFIVGVDSFNDVQIDSSAISGFWYFKNTKKGLIKRFVLQRTGQIEKACVVTLIKKSNGKFTPRFDFQIWNTTKKACEQFSKEKVDENLIKAKVSFDSCYDNFSTLIDFIRRIEEIDFGSSSYAVVDKAKKIYLKILQKILRFKILQKNTVMISQKKTFHCSKTVVLNWVIFTNY